MKFTGERMIPAENRGDFIYTDHVCRYIHVSSLVRGKTLLDAGCGAGYGSYLLASHFARSVTGIDISQETVNYARSTYTHPNLRFIQSDIRSLPFHSNVFDTVVAFEILEHIEEHDLFLSETKRVLPSGGTLIISTPDIERYKSDNEFHAKELTSYEFAELLGKYYKNIGIYFQSEQLASVIQKRIPQLAATDQSNTDFQDESRLDDFQVFGRFRDTGRFNIAVCSDETIPDPGNLLLLNDSKDWIRFEKELIRTRNALRNVTARLNLEVKTQSNQIDRLKTKITNIERSRAYKFALFLSGLKKKFQQ
jgi:2-polyprenyl-3-methyl-5-hydroxy-6-metoxy-1,4-benzoquinol methylase